MTRFLCQCVMLATTTGLCSSVFASTEHSNSDYSSAFYCNGQARYSWYCDDPEPEAKPPATPPAPPQVVVVTPAQPRIQDMKTVEEVRKELERLQGVAIINPTPENIRVYVEAQQWMMQKGAVFADVWQRVVWAHPELDDSLRSPTAGSALNLAHSGAVERRNQTLDQLAAGHGIFFVFRSDCPYCHAYAPVLKRWAARYGIEVFPVSLDGGGLPEFPNAHTDNGFAAHMNVTTVPATFLADKNTGDVLPVGFGLLTESDLYDRIVDLTHQPGQDPWAVQVGAANSSPAR